MAIFSSTTLISSLGVFNLICAYFLLTAPAVVASHNMVTVLASTVNLPIGTWKATNEAIGLLAAVLALLGISDLSAAAMRQEIAAFYWQSQAPIRLTFFFGLTAYAYSHRPGGLWVGWEESLSLGAIVQGTRGGLGSGVVFAWAFLETMMWFWIYITLRDERMERTVVERRGHSD